MQRKLWLILTVVMLSGWSLYCPAESAPEPAAEESLSVAGENESRWYDFMPGETSADKLYLGMWSYHFSDKEDYESQHDLLGLVYDGYFLGTFINSKNDRAWGLGLQRDFYQTTKANLRFEAGYRAGILYGYEGGYEIGDSKLFPLIMLYGDVSYQRAGLQFAWGGEVVTAGFMIRLD